MKAFPPSFSLRRLRLPQLGALALGAFFLSASNLIAQTDSAQLDHPSHALVLPTDNDALFRGEYDKFFMFVDRNFEKKQTTPWEGGAYGFVRGPHRLGNRVLMMAFHEGIDIAPVKRDAKGEPLDEIRAVAEGKVVHASDLASASNYGKYVVVEHQWGEGPMYSLYAHLSRVDVQVGQMLTQNQVLGIMGHTGSGLDRRRSHLHLELNLLVNSGYEHWHRRFFGAAENKHGIFNGMNLLGWNVTQFYLERQKNPQLRVSEFIQKQEVLWKVRVPKRGGLELIQRYPWLKTSTFNESDPTWELSFEASGLPVAVGTSDVVINGPRLIHVKNQGMPYTFTTKGMIVGSGEKPQLSDRGKRHLELILGVLP